MDPIPNNNLEIFNPGPKSTALNSFLYFNRLPLELRWKIWEIELRHERLLHVELRPLSSAKKAKNSDGACDETSTPYKVILTEFQPISKLAHVNSESREITSRFYRVQLPCRYRWDGKDDFDGIFYFNPELDTLEVRGKLFADFAQDLWVRDPRHVGLINVALDEIQFIAQPPDNFGHHRKRDVYKSGIDHLRQALSRLERVIFIYLGGLQRMFIGEPRRSDGRSREMHLYRPIMAAVPKFDRLSHDPRSLVKPTLDAVYLTNTDPRVTIRRWFKLLATCKVKHDHEVEYSFMVAYGGRNMRRYKRGEDFSVDPGWFREESPNPVITNRNEAVDWVQEQEARWKAYLQYFQEEMSMPYPQQERPSHPVVGFWLFPIEALGPLPDPKSDRSERNTVLHTWRSHRRIDLSGYKPKLCLSYLP
ncbi:hypothetical protein FDECE_6447 [Fusarium decemcellulare]|nr:hypothetical protein FDECE_6447 [Fusarium decemcellulare]